MPWIKTYHPPGTEPGTLSSAAAPGGAPVSLHRVSYRADAFFEETTPARTVPAESPDTSLLTWVHVTGRPDPDSLRALGTRFGLHDLALEDVLNTGQRPKLDSYPEHLFLVLNLPAQVDGALRLSQVSLFAGENYLLSFCESPIDPFEPIRQRLRPPNNARIRTRGIDYLLYCLVDLVIDAGFPVLDALGERIEAIEERMLEHPERDTLAQIHRQRRDLLQLRRMLWPQREVVSALLHGDLPLIGAETQPYLRDCYDHVVQIIDLQESYRDLIANLLDLYVSSISHRTNEIMRVLTIIATIFIPLTFIVGIYGMNFDTDAGPWSMPELRWPFGYLGVWGVMLAVVAGLLWYFRRKDWL